MGEQLWKDIEAYIDGATHYSRKTDTSYSPSQPTDHNIEYCLRSIALSLCALSLMFGSVINKKGSDNIHVGEVR